MKWRELSAAYEAGCIGYWYSIPEWHRAEIIATHEVKQAILAEGNKRNEAGQ